MRHTRKKFGLRLRRGNSLLACGNCFVAAAGQFRFREFAIGNVIDRADEGRLLSRERGYACGPARDPSDHSGGRHTAKLEDRLTALEHPRNSLLHHLSVVRMDTTQPPFATEFFKGDAVDLLEPLVPIDSVAKCVHLVDSDW